MKTINDEPKNDELKDAGVETASTVSQNIKEGNITCCEQHCIKNLLDNNEASLRIFIEEWLRLESIQK